jgi:Zn-dependent protease with chaperone function
MSQEAAVATRFPKTFVDEKSGEVKKLETLWDKVTGDWIPEAGHYTMIAAKVAVLAPVAGGLAVTAGAAAAVYLGTRWGMNKVFNLIHDKVLLENKKGDFSEYDLTKPADKMAFEQRFGEKHPQFADDYLKMAQDAKLKQVPRLLVIEEFFKKQGKSRFGTMVSDFMAGVTTRPSGKDPVVLLGKGALQELDGKEMRAVMAHEFTHAKLGHPKDSAQWLMRLPVNSVLNMALVGFAVLGPLPVLPVLGFVLATNFVGKVLKSVKSRHHEELCDRGAAILTGGTGDLSNALDKIKAQMVKYKVLERKDAARKAFLRGDAKTPDMKEEKLPEPSKFNRFVNATHPSNERRRELLDAFEKKHGEYCEKKRSDFAAGFNAAAARVKAHPPLVKPDLKNIDADLKAVIEEDHTLSQIFRENDLVQTKRFPQPGGDEKVIIVVTPKPPKPEAKAEDKPAVPVIPAKPATPPPAP